MTATVPIAITKPFHPCRLVTDPNHPLIAGFLGAAFHACQHIAFNYSKWGYGLAGLFGFLAVCPVMVLAAVIIEIIDTSRQLDTTNH